MNRIITTFLPLSFISFCYVGAQSEKPNIVIILADDLGYSDLSCYDSHHVSSPVLDSLACNGIRFTDFYAGSPVCSPSRAALMTGRNANRVGVYSWIPPREPLHLKLSELCIPEILKEEGYKTSHFGKWHLGMWDREIPTISPSLSNYGFDYWFATDNNAKPSHHNPENFIRNGVAVGGLDGYSCQLVADEAIEWLKTNHDPSVPFYLNIWFNEPHKKVAAPDEFKKKHLANGIDEHMANYYGCIENMDNAIGRILDKIEDINALDNTLLIFSSDNGSQQVGSNGVLRGMKSDIWEGGIRVPAIAYWKNHIPANTICSDPCGLIDIFPTIHKLIDSKHTLDYTIDGVSLLPLFKGESMKRDKPLYVFYHRSAAAVLRDGDWCLIGNLSEKGPQINYFAKPQMEFILRAIPSTFELYNLRNDIGQKNNVAAKYPEIVERLKEEMISLYIETIEEGGDLYKTSERD